MFVRILNNTVVERFATLPVFTPELMATIFPADSSVQEGWITADGGKTFSAPPPPPAPPPPAKSPLADLADVLVAKGVLQAADLPISVKALQAVAVGDVAIEAQP